MIRNIKDRYLPVGTKCEYHCAAVNGTGYCCGMDCIISEIISSNDRIYKVTETCNKPREWIVQDYDETEERKRIGDNFGFVTWIVVKE